MCLSGSTVALRGDIGEVRRGTRTFLSSLCGIVLAARCVFLGLLWHSMVKSVRYGKEQEPFEAYYECCVTCARSSLCHDETFEV